MAVNGLSFSWAGRHLVTYQCIRVANLLVTCPYMSDMIYQLQENTFFVASGHTSFMGMYPLYCI